ncbi:hypothetical protein L2E82_42131 [Cichorium intybus]|uniref:Uncharacterized protein n=1 Tax=Cichorium intybus TaxID=13427 RepID=A0ACB8ZMG0_CICIN|nr:hypothetical protein L2E82_42131 [Cichorium intybus]
MRSGRNNCGGGGGWLLFDVGENTMMARLERGEHIRVQRCSEGGGGDGCIRWCQRRWRESGWRGLLLTAEEGNAGRGAGEGNVMVVVGEKDGEIEGSRRSEI